MTEHEAYVAFNLTDNIGSVGVGELAAHYGSVAAAWEAYPKKTARDGGAVDWREELSKAHDFGVAVLTPCDPGYPEILRATRGHPLVLYVKGDVAALSKPAIAIVGTRRATPYGYDQAARFGHDLAAKGWVIVSGLAAGIDGEAHRGALDAGGITVGILGSGLDAFYPEQNRGLAREMVKKGGAVVSEFPFGRKPDQQTFPQRNHVVAALARGVVAVEAPVKSGTLITTGIAADLGRIVMAIPSRVDSAAGSGCLTLIREGAVLVRCPADVDEEMRGIPRPTRKQDTFDPQLPLAFAPNGRVRAPREPDSAPSPAPAVPPDPPLSLEEARIMRELDAEGVSLDALVVKTGLSAQKVGALSMTLRLKGMARFLPGNRLALPRGK